MLEKSIKILTLSKMKNIKIAPSILSCDFGRLKEEIVELENSGADLLHLDIMDGHFVPNLSFGFPVVEAIIKYSNLPVSIHLMIYNSGFYAERFLKLMRANDMLIMHTKAEINPLKIFERMKEKGAKLGVAYNPDEEDLPYIEELSHIVDHILIMSVYPGFGAQEYIEGSEKMVRRAAEIRERLRKDFDIGVDGGINEKTSKIVIEAGANVLVAGNYIFKAKSYAEAIRKLRG